MALPGAAQDRDWRWAFLAGLIAAPLAVMAMGGTVAQTVPDDLGGMAVAGLLVGLGTALGSGCTSGHEVCGPGAAVGPAMLVGLWLGARIKAGRNLHGKGATS